VRGVRPWGMEVDAVAVRYEPKSAGLEALLRGPVATQLVNSHSAAVASRAGRGYTFRAVQGASRYRSIVFADTIGAKRREAKQNNLLRALG
jgi:hypothetical protein